MQLNRKLTGALAWGGLALVLLIPSADFISGQLGGGSLFVGNAERTPAASETAAATPAPSAPAGADATRVAAVDPVADYLSRNKTLPDYISGGGAPASKGTPAVAAPVAPAQIPPPVAAPAPPAAAAPAPTVEVARAPEPLVAPIPMPAEMRPKPRPAAVAAPAPAPIQPPPVLVDEGPVDRVAAPRNPRRDDLILPPEPIRTVPPEDVLRPPANVGRDGGGWRDRDGWIDEEEDLATYLEREGLIGGGERRRRAREDYDADGFYLDEGPNGGSRDSSIIFLSR